MSASLPITPEALATITSASETTITRGKINSLNNIAQTWNEPIPFHSGSMRVSGKQIWSSDFYSIISTTTKITTATFPASSFFGVSQTIDPRITTDVDKTETAVIDVAYAFGYNALQGKRILTKIRFDGTVVFDLATGFNKFDFDVYYGSEDKQDPTIKLDMDDRTPYYPGMIYIVSWGIVAPLPTSIDAEFAQEKIIDTSIVGRNIPAIVGIPFPDYINRKLYTYEPGTHKVRTYNIDTFELLSGPTSVAALTSGGNGKLEGSALVWFQKLGVFIGYEQNHSGAYVKIYAINPASGGIVASTGNGDPSGSDEPVPGPNGGVPAWFKGVRSKDTITDATAILSVIHVGNSYPIYLDLHRSGTSISFSPGKIGSSVEGGPCPTAYSYPGDDGVAAFTYGGSQNYVINGHSILPVNGLDAGSGNQFKVVIYDRKAFWFERYKIHVTNENGGFIKTKTYENRLSEAQANYQNYPNCTCGFFGGSDVGYIHLTNLRTLDTQFLTASSSALLSANFWDCSTAYCAALIGDGSKLLEFPLITYGGTILLRDWIRACYVATTMFTPEQITFTDINDEIYGAIIAEPQDLSPVIDNIRKLFRIEKEEVNDTIHFYRNRNDTTPDNVAAYVDYQDLAALVEGQQNLASLNSMIAGTDINRPQLKLNFIDKDADYATNSVGYKQPGSKSTATEEISVPLVLDKTIALNLLQNVYGDAVASTTTHSLRLPYSLMYVSSGDILGIYKDQFRIFVRITEETVNGDFSISCKASTVAVVKRPKITDTLVPDRPRPAVDPNPNGTTKAIIIDIPSLIDSDVPASNEKYQQHAILYSEDDGWRSGYLSRQKNEQWRTLFAGGKGSNPTILKAGSVLTECGHRTDTTELTVEYVVGNWPIALAKTAAQLYLNNTLNMAAYGQPGRWELVRFQRIENGKVKGIIRGCRGTDWATGLHQLDDLFIILNGSIAQELRDLPEEFEAEIYRPVTTSMPFDTGENFTHTSEGNSLKPWPVCRVKAVMVSSTIEISWSRRDRKGGGWGVVPPNTDGRIYEVDILNDTGDVLRTLSIVNSELVAYTNSMQTTDGYSGTLRLAIYQIGSTIGRGFVKRATINV